LDGTKQEDNMDDLRTVPERLTTDLSAGLQQFTRLFGGDHGMLEQMSEMSGEFARFMTARLMRNLDTMRTMSQCRGPAEIIELQLRWAQDAFDDYMAEAGRFMQRNARLEGRSVEGVAKPVATKAGAKSGT
jgi:Phasin protein